MPLTAPQQFRCAVIPLACAKRAVSSHAMLACHNVRAVESIVASTQELLVTGRATGDKTFARLPQKQCGCTLLVYLGALLLDTQTRWLYALCAKTNSDQQQLQHITVIFALATQ